MKLDELRNQTLREIALCIRTGKTSPIEILRLLIEQIHRTEDKVRAYVTVCEEDALRLAETAEFQIKTGRDLGPLHGIPVSIKDLFETAGIKTTCGSKLMADYIPKRDSTVVERLKGAGAIVLGKTNTHEFALGSTTPPTKNPWNLNRIAGGSSGGSAAALAASSALAATGSDTGGSIRIPASFCGVVGLKPTYSRVSRAGLFPQSWSLDTAGPIASRVEDAALLLTVMAGHDERDQTSSREPVPNYLDALNEEMKDVRLGLPANYFFDDCEPDVNSSVREGVDVLRGLGCGTIEFEFPRIPEIRAAQAVLELVEPCATHARSLVERGNDFAPESRLFLEQALFIPAVDYVQALRFRAIVYSEIQRLFEHFDLIVTPTEPLVAPKIGEQLTRVGTLEEDINISTGRYVAPFNLIGLPTISIPCGFSSDGLPIGMQIIGRPFDEATIIRVAHAYESKLKLYKKHPNWT